MSYFCDVLYIFDFCFFVRGWDLTDYKQFPQYSDLKNLSKLTVYFERMALSAIRSFTGYSFVVPELYEPVTQTGMKSSRVTVVRAFSVKTVIFHSTSSLFSHVYCGTDVIYRIRMKNKSDHII